MLLLSRKVGQEIVINHNIVVRVQRIQGSWVQLALEAPRDVPIVRGELEPAQKETEDDDA